MNVLTLAMKITLVVVIYALDIDILDSENGNEFIWGTICI
jgi:hypothetical protein